MIYCIACKMYAVLFASIFFCLSCAFVQKMVCYDTLYCAYALVLQVIFLLLKHMHNHVLQYFVQQIDMLGYLAILLFVLHALSYKYNYCMTVSYTSLLLQLCYYTSLVHGMLDNSVTNFVALFVTVKRKEPFYMLIANVVSETLLYVLYQKYNKDTKLCIRKSFVATLQLLFVCIFAYMLRLDATMCVTLFLLRLAVCATYTPLEPTQCIVMLTLATMLYILFFLTHQLYLCQQIVMQIWNKGQRC